METSSQIFLLVTIIHGTVAEINSTRCLHDDGFYQCGNICTEKDNSCICGNITIGHANTNHYCCLPPEKYCQMKTECLEYAYDDIFGEYDYEDCVKSSERIECPAGQVTHKSEPCHGVCHDNSKISLDNDGTISCDHVNFCDYNHQWYPQFMCGDLCMKVSTAINTVARNSICYCGNQTLEHDSPQFCCTSPHQHCHYNGTDGICEAGQVLDKTETCHGVCYNSYRHSGILGDHAHLSCPDDKCVPVEDVRHELDDRCRGALVGVCGNSTQDRAANKGSRRFHNHRPSPV